MQYISKNISSGLETELDKESYKKLILQCKKHFASQVSTLSNWHFALEYMTFYKYKLSLEESFESVFLFFLDSLFRDEVERRKLAADLPLGEGVSSGLKNITDEIIKIFDLSDYELVKKYLLTLQSCNDIKKQSKFSFPEERKIPKENKMFIAIVKKVIERELKDRNIFDESQPKNVLDLETLPIIKI